MQAPSTHKATTLQLDDLDADGKMDMFLLLKEGVWKSQIESKPTKLVAVRTAFGEETRITYKSLMDPAVYKTTIVTTPAKTILHGPLEVVAEIKKSNGLGGFFSTRYTYENGAYDNQALGFLGFEKRHIFEDSAGTETIETYSQDIEKLSQGTLIKSEVYLNGSGNPVLISRSSTEIDSVQLGTHPLHRAFIEKASFSSFYDEQGRETYSLAVSKEFDALQNTTLVTTILTDAKGTHTTRAETRFRNDLEHWVLGLPERVTTTATTTTAPGQSSVKTSAFDYDVAGLLSSETMEPDSPLWIKKEYPRTRNQFGLIDAVITSWGPAHSKGLNFSSITSSQEFDSSGFVLATTNALGHQKFQTIDPDTGLTLTATDENGLVNRFTYDAANRPESTESPDGHMVTIERNMCDQNCPTGAVMSQRQISNRDGTATAYVDSLGRTIRSVQSLYGDQLVAKDKVYDQWGLLVRESKPYFLNDGPTQWINFGYDERNRQNLVIMPDGAQSKVIHDGLTTTSIDPMGRSTISEQDSRGLLQTMTNPKGEVLSYSYDAAGQLRELKDAGGNITRMEYDLFGRRTLLDDPSTGISSTEYNALSQVAEQTRQGRKTTNSYDALGRTLSTERSVPGTPSLTESYVYDSARYGVGQLAEATGPDSSLSLSYDSLSRPLESTVKLLGKTYSKLSTYDSLGRIQTHTYPGGLTVAYDYDAVGQVKSIRDKQSNKVFWNLESLYPNGDLKEYTLGNGSRGFKKQDERTDRIIGETVSAPDRTLQMARTYDHDLVGNLTTRTDSLTGKTEAFTYDPLDRLESFVGTAFKTVAMHYDSLSRITERSDVGSYEYGVGCTGGFNSPFAPKKVGGKSFCTDARGNVTSAGDRTLSYDANNLPVEMRQGNNSVRYSYGLGRSVLAKDEMIEGERTLTRFVGEEFETVEAAGSTKQRSYVGDFLVIETEGSEYRENYLYKDYLGSTLAAADQNAAIVERMDYDPFGQRRNVDDLSWLEAGSFKAKTTSRGFTGHDQIDSMNLVHMKGRVYDPTIGLFLTPDPYIQDPTMAQNLNRYSYVVNNPLRYNDPTGHFFEGIGRELNRALTTGGKALQNPGAFLKNTWNKIGRGASDPRYQRLAASIAISVVATVYCPLSASSAWYQTAAYYAAVGATSSYVASNGDSKAALNGAYTGAAFNMVGSYFQFASNGAEMSNSLIAAKIAAHGVVGGLSAQNQGGSFESGFLSAGLSQAAGQLGVYEQLGASNNAQGMGIAYNAGVAAVVGGTISSATGGSFESGALNAAMGRLFNDEAHSARDLFTEQI
ncbi:MAG: hypothetical protein NTX25_13620, partial [Proteobacteria bacterium]|nr:hypothetical protein [Pseudomonadota bacterium]